MTKIAEPLDHVAEEREAATKGRVAKLRSQGQKLWCRPEPLKPRVGRPPKLEIERLKVKVWYWKLWSLRPEGWNDAKLDEFFGGQKGAARLKIFERMRTKGWFPRDVHALEGFKNIKRPKELVARIDETPPFEGTRKLLEAPFWTVFGKNTKDIASVRLALNECLDRNALLRLEGNLNVVIDSQVQSIIQNPEKRLAYISSAGVYTHWLIWELQQIPDHFERLILVGLLLRESLLLAYLDMVLVLKQVLNEQVHQIAKQPWLTPIRDDFVRIVTDYILRGHIDLRNEELLYDGGSRQAVHGYIISKDNTFLDDDTGDAVEKDAWSKDLGSTCNWVAAAVRGIDGQWDPTDAEYHEAAYQDWLRDRDDPNVQWPDCPDDGGSFVTDPEDWPSDLL